MTMHQLFIDFKRACVLCNILIEFGIPVKLVRVIKMCLNESYSNIWISKYLSDTFPVKNSLKHGSALLPLIFNFSVEYAITRVHVGQDGLKLKVHISFWFMLMLIYWVKAYML